MSQPDPPGLEARVARLERLVERLVEQHRAPPDRPPPPPPRSSPPKGAPDPAERPIPPPPPPSRPPRGAASAAPFEFDSERWLGRIGVGFVILAVALLVKLSFDRGWITPTIRVGLGLVLGAGMIVGGLRLEAARRNLAQALLGGGVALLYLVGFAADQFYGLVSTGVSLAFMSAVTVLAIVLSERQDSPALSVIGVAGGFATPFLLGLGGTDPGSVAVYASAVLAGAGVVQFVKRWPELMMTLVAGSVLVGAGLVFGRTSPAPRGAVVLFIALIWLTSVASPVLRPLFLPAQDEETPWATRIFAVVGIVAATGFLAWHLGLDERSTAFLILGQGLAIAVMALVGRGNRDTRDRAAELSALATGGGLLLVAAMPMNGFLLMAEAALLLLLAARIDIEALPDFARLVSVAAGVVFLASAMSADATGFLGFQEGAFVRLGILALAVACAFQAGERRAWYGGAAYVGLLVWFAAELAPRPNGQTLLSIAWALQGAATFLFAISRRSRPVQHAGLATLALVGGKLLLVDLDQADPFVRVLLFLGFGATLIGLAYLANRPKRGSGMADGLRG